MSGRLLTRRLDAIVVSALSFGLESKELRLYQHLETGRWASMNELLCPSLILFACALISPFSERK